MDLHARELRKNGVKLKLQQQPFQILVCLVERPGEIVTREQLIQQLWPDGTVIEYEHSLATAVNKIRQALGDTANSPRFVETVPRRGYRFIPTDLVSGPGGGTDESVRAGPPPKWKLASLVVGVAVASAGGGLMFRDFIVGTREALPLCADSAFLYERSSSRPWRRDPGATWTSRPLSPPTADTSPSLETVERCGSKTLTRSSRGSWKEPKGRNDHSGRQTLISSGLPQGEKSRRSRSTEGRPFRSVPRLAILWMGPGAPTGGSIVFSSGLPPRLYEVPSRGGTASLLVSPEATEESPEAPWGAILTPHFLPPEAGGRFLVFAFGLPGHPTLMLEDLETRRRDVLTPGLRPFYSRSGHLVFQTAYYGGGLWAIPFSLSTSGATGEAFFVARNAQFATVSTDQTLVYLDAPASGLEQLVWLDRAGNRIGEIGQAHEDVEWPSLSPDGSLLAFSATEHSNEDVWVYDIARGIRTRLTDAQGRDMKPVWSPSGDEVAFTGREYNRDIFLTPADGSGPVEELLATATHEYLTDWSRDGEYMLLYMKEGPVSQRDLWYLKRDQEASRWNPHRFAQTSYNERAAKLSPNGQYVAYVSDESSRLEVYVQPFPRARGGSRCRVTAETNHGGAGTVRSCSTWKEPR